MRLHARGQPLDDFELRVLTAKGEPLPGVDISWIQRTNGCGSGQHWGATDANGMARFDLIAEIVQSLTLMQSKTAVSAGEYDALKSEGLIRDLTESELRTLFFPAQADDSVAISG
jgi:acyl-coenzyme A synthetase/AMP-(fatty) acid ligase